MSKPKPPPSAFAGAAKQKIAAAAKRVKDAGKRLDAQQAKLASVQATKAKYEQEMGSHFDNALKLQQQAKLGSAQYSIIEYHALSSVAEGNYQGVFDALVKRGYRLHNFDGYEIDHATTRGATRRGYFNVIFTKFASNLPWYAFHGLDAGTYQAKFNELTRQGFRLARITSYPSGGSIRYAPLFIKQNWSAWTAYHGVTGAVHQQQFNSLVKQGYRLVGQSAVFLRGQEYVAALYDKQNVGRWWARGNLTPAQYQQYFNEYVAQGCILSDVQVADYNGQPRFYAVWNSEKHGAWQARHNLTADAYHAEHAKWTAGNYGIRRLVGYLNGGVVNFAALWKQG